MADRYPRRSLTRYQKRWVRAWLTIALVGLFLFVFGIEPDILGLDRSPVVGFVQIGLWLFGLALLLLGLYSAIRVLRNGLPHTLRADIGARLIATGYVLAAAASLADFISIGSHQMPCIHFGELQTVGLVLGLVISLLGVLLYYPWSQEHVIQPKDSSPPEPQPIADK